ncbi:hypothetical protein C8R46DRAFT_1228044 [Mycena filopes]|nr:hypothetical protein C8R46DRAFT_1228044 [Mycena filopes]
MSLEEHHKSASLLAHYLGLDSEARPPSPPAKDEALDLLAELVDTRSPALSNFAARFLPSLVAAYTSTPEPGGLYSRTMVPVTGTAYFGKFMRTTLGRNLYLFHTRNMIQMDTSTLNPMDVLDVIIIFFNLMLFSGEGFKMPAEETCRQLLEWFNCVGQNSRGVLALHIEAPCDFATECHMAILFWSTHVVYCLTGASTVENTAAQSCTPYLPWRMCAETAAVTFGCGRGYKYPPALPFPAHEELNEELYMRNKSVKVIRRREEESSSIEEAEELDVRMQPSRRATAEETENVGGFTSHIPTVQLARPSRKKGKSAVDPTNWGDVSFLENFAESKTNSQKVALDNSAGLTRAEEHKRVTTPCEVLVDVSVPHRPKPDAGNAESQPQALELDSQLRQFNYDASKSKTNHDNTSSQTLNLSFSDGEEIALLFDKISELERQRDEMNSPKVKKGIRDQKSPTTPRLRAVTPGRLAAGSFLDNALRGVRPWSAAVRAVRQLFEFELRLQLFQR